MYDGHVLVTTHGDASVEISKDTWRCRNLFRQRTFSLRNSSLLPQLAATVRRSAIRSLEHAGASPSPRRMLCLSPIMLPAVAATLVQPPFPPPLNAGRRERSEELYWLTFSTQAGCASKLLREIGKLDRYPAAGRLKLQRRRPIRAESPISRPSHPLRESSGPASAAKSRKVGCPWW